MKDARTRLVLQIRKWKNHSLLSHSYMLISFLLHVHMCVQLGLHFTEWRKADEDFFALSNFTILIFFIVPSFTLISVI
jgi:hypothetical protein